MEINGLVHITKETFTVKNQNIILESNIKIILQKNPFVNEKQQFIKFKYEIKKQLTINDVLLFI